MSIARLLVPVVMLAGFASPAPAQSRQSTLARIVCSSQEQGYQFCEVETRYGVRLTRQVSRARCDEGTTWGYDRRGIWVDRGCAAEFEVGDSGYGRPAETAGYQVQSGEKVGVPGDVFTCESRDGRRRYCAADLRGLAPTVVRNISRDACVRGQNWDYDARGVWVDLGCRAEFRVVMPVAPIGQHAGSSVASNDTMRCESRDFRRISCDTGRNRGVELSRQLSKTRCSEGDTWGWDRHSVWVDGGCGGEFVIVR